MRIQTMRAAVERGEIGMRLEDEVGLSVKPEAGGFEMRQHGFRAVVGGRGIDGAGGRNCRGGGGGSLLCTGLLGANRPGKRDGNQEHRIKYVFQLHDRTASGRRDGRSQPASAFPFVRDECADPACVVNCPIRNTINCS